MHYLLTQTVGLAALQRHLLGLVALPLHLRDWFLREKMKALKLKRSSCGLTTVLRATRTIHVFGP